MDSKVKLYLKRARTEMNMANLLLKTSGNKILNDFGIQEDSGKILLFIYDSFINNKPKLNAQILLEETKWDGNRIDRAVKYLKGIGAIDIVLTMGNHQGVQHFILKKITPLGINAVEDQPEFKKNFSFEVNLDLLKFSWGASEK